MRDFSEINNVAARNAHTPLGHIGVSGQITNGVGIPDRPMRVLGTYALVYLIDGTGQYRDGNGCSQRLLPGDALLLFPELPHTYGPDTGGVWSEFYTMFEGPIFDLLRTVRLLDSTLPIRHLDPLTGWLPRIQQAVLSVWYAEPESRTAEIGRFVALLTEVLAADVPAVEDRCAENWLAMAQFLMEADLTADVDMERIARRTGVSYETFRKRFQLLSGQSPAHYRMNLRIRTAADLLRNTTMSNRQVAESVGYADEYTFYKRFKQIMGETPRSFRHNTDKSLLEPVTPAAE